ncbi:MBL fold metallo-hydrolase [Nocardiopsis changdeensis]|uniref:MBL fold metallo-hydrolase n=1 Tax=Nocardiopsis TaxID=2013 RepID=UPI002105C9A7|nr:MULTISPECIES: MBL fold metallo-hydrolase [Nocardiopsis]
MTGRSRPFAVLDGLTAPDLAAWDGLWQEPAPPEPGALRVKFLGVSTLLLHDGEHAVLTDGFFSRPSPLRLALGGIAPDRARIRACLRRYGVGRVDALFVAHSHYDHALDSATVAAMTGATLMGSASTRNIALGQGFPGHRFREVVTGRTVEVGGFELTALPAAHSPGDRAPGSVRAPLWTPARASGYRTGDCYALHVHHGGRGLLVQASANSVPGALDGYRAETVYLGIGALGRQDEEFRERYWEHTVTALGARRVVPIHWDDFLRPLHRPLRPLPLLFDDMAASMDFLVGRGRADGVSVRLPRLGRDADPWA